ncbi:MAG: FAD-dependent oxidoreductase [Saprospiraceae bacterium]
MNYSFWEKYFIESPSDITILGSGIVGLSTAISIKESRPDLSIKILERGTLPYGASTKNAGFSCFGSVSELRDDIQLMGVNACIDLVKMRYKGLQKLKSRVGEKVLEYEHCGGIELFRKTDKEIKEVCLASIHDCNQLIVDALGIQDCYTIQSNEKLTAFDKVSIFNQYEGTIQPFSMMNFLTKLAASLDISIIYGIEVTNIDMANQKLISKAGLEINYSKLVVCTNGFVTQLLPDLQVSPGRNQVIITKPLLNNPLLAGYHLDKGYVYFRSYGGRILLGGGRNIDQVTETTHHFGETETIQNYLHEILESIHPGASDHIDHRWSGILGVGESKYPIIEWLDDHVLIGVRLGGMGVAIGSYLGQELSDEICHLYL